MNQAEAIKERIAKIVAKHNVGAPNSVARYLSEHTFGKNKWIVLERVNGELVLRAAQTTYDKAYEHWMKDPKALILVDVEQCWIVQDERNADAAIAWANKAADAETALIQAAFPKTKVDALEEIQRIAGNCLAGQTPLIARQTFGAALRNIQRLASEALQAEIETPSNPPRFDSRPRKVTTR